MIWKPDRAMHFDSLKSEKVRCLGESTIFQLYVHKPFRFVEYVRITKLFFWKLGISILSNIALMCFPFEAGKHKIMRLISKNILLPFY